MIRRVKLLRRQVCLDCWACCGRWIRSGMRGYVKWAVVVLGLVAAAGVAHAQTSPSAMLDQFRAVRLTWLSVAATYANRLFGLLAVIEFAWTAAILVLERTDLQGWTAALIRKMMFLLAVLALLHLG